MISNYVKLTFTLLQAVSNHELYYRGAKDQNNISADFGSVLNIKQSGDMPFLLGVSKFGEHNLVDEELSYFMGDLSDTNGDFPYSYILRFNGESDIVTICFNDVENGYPKTVILDGESITLYSPIHTFSLNTELPFHQMTFSNWSIPNSPFVVKGIYAINTLEIDNNSLLALDVKTFDRGDITLPSWGIHSNSGSIEFKDPFEQLKMFAKNNSIYDNSSTEVFLRTPNRDFLLGTYLANDWQFDSMKKVATISLTDGLLEWQDISVPKKVFNGEMTLYDLFIYLKNTRTPKKWRGLIQIADDSTRTLLRNVTIYYPMLEKGSLWSQWQKFCEVSGCYMYRSVESKIFGADIEGIFIYYNGGL